MVSSVSVASAGVTKCFWLSRKPLDMATSNYTGMYPGIAFTFGLEMVSLAISGRLQMMQMCWIWVMFRSRFLDSDSTEFEKIDCYWDANLSRANFISACANYWTVVLRGHENGANMDLPSSAHIEMASFSRKLQKLATSKFTQNYTLWFSYLDWTWHHQLLPAGCESSFNNVNIEVCSYRNFSIIT